MKFVDEYRSETDAQKFVHAIKDTVTQPWTLMEICGGQTHTLIKSGIDHMLPAEVTLVHGPGCPVCVTPLELIDKAIAIARRPNVIFTSFGDMLRVPGSGGRGQETGPSEEETGPSEEETGASEEETGASEEAGLSDLLSVKAAGGDVRMVYSPLDAVKLAQQNPDRQVVFFAVGFETTAPANAMAVWQAKQLAVENFSILCSHVLVPQAMEVILGSPGNQVQGFLAAGHVCAVMGFWEYEPLAEKYQVPIIVTGFEPLDLLQGIYMTVKALEEGRWGVENQYARSVTREGNVPAQKLMQQVFEVTDRQWRGIGAIPQSGYQLRPEFAAYDAEQRFDVAGVTAQESELCIAGQILQGLKKPHECEAFSTLCTPEHPLGAPMVSSEGACAAYYQYGRAEEAA
ncbi:MAG: Hydrogenase maturation factor HypD [Anaerolineales bacterium]|nr:Hydrogenase maturation factor HypD [Anaerolineales bacterium]